MKVTMKLIVIGGLETVPKDILKGLEELEIGGQSQTIQTTTLIRLARILRRVMKTCRDLLSFRLQWKIISERWCEEFARNNNKDRVSLRKW